MRRLIPLCLSCLLALAACDPPPPSRLRDSGPGGSGGADADGDGISDEHEGRSMNVDTDGDGTPDYLDEDSDGDGIPDAEEAGDADLDTPPRDSDSDLTPDFRDLDSDDNGILDAEETRGDVDGDGIPDFQDRDDDGDFVLDAQELAGIGLADTDGDGRLDHQDPDADNDFILDGHEIGADTDEDGEIDMRDLDSDGDGVPDAEEAGDDDLFSPPVDTDEDGIPDFRDADSDDDGLSDRDEVARSTSRTSADTDGDGVSDLVEVAYGSDPTMGDDSPRTRGDFVFVVPYSEPGMPPIEPTPPRDTLSFSTSLRRVDVYVAIDSSGSMRGEIDNLTAGFRTTVVPEIMRRIPEAQFGVGRFEDCTSSSCANSINNLQDITADAAAVETALRSITTLCGGSEPYRQMLWLLATGDTSAFSGRISPTTRRCADPASVGWPCFRPDAVKVIIQVGDEPMAQDSCSPGRSHAMATSAMTAAGIRYIGIESGNATLRGDMRSVGTDTGSVSSTTGAPFVYTISSDGTGLSTTVVDAVVELSGNIPIRVDAIPTDDPSDAVDAVASFVERMESNTSGATVLGRVCTAGLPTADGDDPDAIDDHFPAVLPGTSVCFDIVARPNQSVPAIATPQLFRATISVLGDLFTPLDERDVYFLVPPLPARPGGPD